MISVFSYGPLALAETKINFDSNPLEAHGKIEANSENLRIDSKTGTATFSGNVEIIRGNITLKAQKIIVSYSIDERANQSIREIVAVDDVFFTSNGALTKADKAVYNIKKNTLELSGNIFVNQAGTKLSGKKLLFDLNTGVGSISGRVKAVLGSDEK